ncbi:MAG: HEAT repeat domain-containing protein [Planctomycetes bacterium]|nr:HEAT repeat domain-containing protein [Planctomycetota bacterium]
MADPALAKILNLLQSDAPADVRRAAALVLGELGAEHKEIGPTLAERLDDADPAVRAETIRALGKLQYDKAMSSLLSRIEHGGEESELAAQAVGRMGTKGAKALQNLMSRVAPGLRRRIAGALGAGGTTSAESAAVDSLLDTDPGVVEAATRSLIAKVQGLTSSHRKALAEHLLKLLSDKKHPAAPVSQTAILRLLATLDDPRVGKVLWDHLNSNTPVEQRAAVLQALSKWCTTPTREQVKRLLSCLYDADFRVAAPALVLLRNVEPDKGGRDWLPLFQAPEQALRRFAIEKLGNRDTPEIAQALMEQIRHPDPGLRDDAIKHLGLLPRGRLSLLNALEGAENPDDAWRFARAQTGWIADLPTPKLKKLMELACRYLEEGDRRYDALAFLLRQADPALLQKQLKENAEHFRQKKNYEKALVYLRQLLRDPACGVEIRLEAAGCGLKTSGHDLTADSRASDPALQQLARLAPNYETECLEFLKKARWLGPEDLFYAGFHFAEQNGPLRNFGGKVLKMVVKKAGKSRLSKDARTKLQSHGLEK